MTLAELQSLFQASVLAEAPSPSLLAQLRPPIRAENVAETFAVYHDGFRQRMAEFLANDYPVLRDAVGETAFEAMVADFWRSRPSKFRNARWVGASLPGFLRATPPYSRKSFVCGLAALEAALAQSFDAEDATSLPIEILGVTREEDWPRLRFGFHPGVVKVQTNAAALAAYEAAQMGEAPSEPADPSEVALVIWRRELEVNYRAMDDLETMALVEAMAGAPFSEICAVLAFSRPEREADALAQAAGAFLARWFADGMIVAAAPAPE
jgi:hypothetical protein